MDLSEKDSWYFIDTYTYNCPVCKRRNVRYENVRCGTFDWDDEDRQVSFYFLECSDCNKVSIHFSDYDIELYSKRFHDPLKIWTSIPGGNSGYEDINKLRSPILRMDDLFLFHLPGSLFSADTRIPNAIREPLMEAANCQKNNYLTGASACLRKSIYMLLRDRTISDHEGTQYLNYEERLRRLKAKLAGTHPHLDGQLINWLDRIQGIASIELHENDWKDLDGGALRFLIAVTEEALQQIYIVPKQREATQQRLSGLAQKAGAARSPQQDEEEQPPAQIEPE